MAVIETLELQFKANLGDLSAQLNALAAQVSTLGAGMETSTRQAGLGLSGGFAQGILGGLPLAKSAALDVNAAAVFSNEGALASAKGAGTALGAGFAQGISSQYGAVMTAANRIANAAASRIRSALQIHSPSRVTFALGGNFGEGFADGIVHSLRGVEAGAAALSAGAASVLNGGSSLRGVTPAEGGIPAMVRSAVNEALGGTQIVIPLTVDGMKLGEASIRGINRVTRSAGRLLLDI